MTEQIIGICGGSGLYEIPGLSNVKQVALSTPFGQPSDEFVVGELGGRRLVFLPRHGRGHRILPSEINYRANIHGFKQLGVQWLISVSAVGSMREEIKPGDFVIVDQFIDWTRHRVSTFFGEGAAGHVMFGDPICPQLQEVLFQSAKRLGATVHNGGTYICMEGPQFSTRAESKLYRQWGVDVIGMTSMPEAKLAREAGLCYATLAMSTDYDCWREGEEAVSVEMVVQTMKKNVETARKIVAEAIANISTSRNCACASAAKYAVITNPQAVPAQTRNKLSLIWE